MKLICNSYRYTFVVMSLWGVSSASGARKAEKETEYNDNSIENANAKEIYEVAKTFEVPKKPNYELTLSAQPDPFETHDPTTQAKVILRNDLFSANHEPIIYYAFLITEDRFAVPPECGLWNSTYDWPPLPNWKNSSTPYQITPVKWNPFKKVEPGTFSTAVFIIGNDSEGANETYYWNGPLASKTKYAFKIRAFTETGFQDTDVLYFETFDKLPVMRILTVLFAIWIIIVMALCFSIFDIECIKRLIATSGRKSKDYFSPVPQALSHRNFLKYAEDLLNNPGRLSNEFHLLGTLSSDVSTLCLHAQRVDNKTKNRYGNILPFDMTRVKLSVADDDPSTDYINASFIKGYSQQVEYIACQGPQMETCHDFYRMILEQNVEIIVMLTALVENGKEKCYKYYPSDGQTIYFKDVSVSCVAEENYGFFKMRKLTVLRRDKKISVTQFHHLEWNDFVCPHSASDMLKFCELIQKTARKGCLVVHCSAGSGRTGTFIAIDILLQRVKQNNKISVFDTVLKLRQQRVGMVQTESQLGYIYKCVSRAIEDFPSKSKENV